MDIVNNSNITPLSFCFHSLSDSYNFVGLNIFFEYFFSCRFFVLISLQAARDVAASLNKNKTEKPAQGIAPRIQSSVDRSISFPKVSSSSTESGPGSSPLQSLEPVNQEDLVEALNSLLSRVGLPPTIKEKQLLSKIIELESESNPRFS